MDYLIFLATADSISSRWCPWEIGYADGTKNTDRILLVQTMDRAGYTYGSEYLDLYRRVDFSSMQKLVAWRPGETVGTHVRDL